MIFEPLLAALAVATVSLSGALFFGNSKKLIGAQRFVVPIAVGVFLSLVLFELIPETLSMAPTFGGVAVAFGFISFYILANVLHKRHHHLEAEECDRRGAASLLVVGDFVHNTADGIILGGAFLVDPALGAATAVGLAFHEIPQEIVEFGVLVRGGFSRAQAALYNFLSASGIILGTAVIVFVAEYIENYIWLLTGIAAGNLLYIAASDLLPRIHGNLKNYGSVWNSATSIAIGFILMTVILNVIHSHIGHGHAHGDTHLHEHDEHEHDDYKHSHEHSDDEHEHEKHDEAEHHDESEGVDTVESHQDV